MKKQQNNIFEQQIMTIVKRLKVTSNHSFTVDEKPFEVYNKHPYTQAGYDLGSFGSNQHYTSKEQRSRLLNAITNQLYGKFYCDNAASQHQLPPITEREHFMNQLSAANCSSDGLDMNWKIYAVDQKGQAFAQKNGVLRHLIPNTYKYATPQQTQAVVNQYVHFYRQKENKKAQAVFYYVYGNEYLSHEGSLARIYWHIKPEGAAKLVSEITNNFNFYNIPFNFKCLNHKALYTRSDSAVLYLDKKHLALTKMMLPHLIKNMDGYLNDSVPLFTQKLGKGVSFAEDPGNGQSFGMSRVQVISEALIEGFQKKITNPEKLTNFVLNYMESMGMSRKYMYRNPRLQTT
ncbi:T3SS effector HopA1 family protein [Aureispira anguillae]|uniref:T3SS effector HopA1 family protein n=1 Tax=Aureispira anguillae TaxID=2864201 RepID=A0A915Y9Z6_9BACT|nr:T3SS effector HopA1 family protein [Aureispira anguillae]BDS09689.1 T3SS effector HopA1 family protein [Aureispira anguillae]